MDKKQIIGGVVLAVALLGVSVATGKLDINKLTGKTDATDAAVVRKLPPPVTESTEVKPGIPDGSVDNEDVLASLTQESGSQSAFIDELAGAGTFPQASASAPADLAVEPSLDPALQPLPQPTAQLASTEPSTMVVGGMTFSATPVVKAGEQPPAPAIGGATVNAANAVPASVDGEPSQVPSISPPPAQPVSLPSGLAKAPEVAMGSGPLPPPGAPGQAGVSKPTSMASVSAPVSSPARANVGEFSSGSSVARNVSGGPSAAAVIASLPTSATGNDLLKLQTQLAVLEKQKAIASGQEAIAESLLNTRKAEYEMLQIGRPSAEQLAAHAQAQANNVAIASPPPPPSPLSTVKLLSTTRANGSIGATITMNGKLIDVRKGSVVAGYLVDKLTDNSLTLIGEGATKTVWID